MNLQGAIKIHSVDKWAWFWIPFIILASSFCFGFILSFLIPVDGNIFVAGFSYVFGYMLMIGIITFTQTFPFAMGMSIRRTDYFVGISIMGVKTSFIFSVLFVGLAAIEKATNGWGSRLDFFYIPYLNDGNIFAQFAIYFITLIHLYFIGLFFTVFTKRFGLKGLLILGLAILFSISLVVYIAHYKELWFNIFQWFKDHSAIQVALWLIPGIVIYFLLSFGIIRKTTV